MVVTEYQAQSEFGYRIAVVADLHDSNPTAVLRKLSEEKPDFIFLCGDILNRCNVSGKEIGNKLYVRLSNRLMSPIARMIELVCTGLLGQRERRHKKEYGYRFLEKVSEIAPTYYSLGNHDARLTRDDYIACHEAGITILNNRDAEIVLEGRRKSEKDAEKKKVKEPEKGTENSAERKNAEEDRTEFKSRKVQKKIVRVGGLSSIPDKKWLEEFSQKDGYKILLCHHPEYYTGWIKGAELDTFNLVISGHTHGGQWRFFGHGVYAPGQGLFPKYAKGKFGKLVISAGVSSTTPIPRLHNPEEIVIIRL